jgi:hypothetical protein
LKEETGYVGENATLIGTARPNAAILSNQCYFVVVENVMKTAELEFDQHEELVTELHSVKNLKRMVKEEQITHSIGLNAIFRLLLHLET